MPGRGSYGAAGKWVHDRAHGIMSKRKSDLTERYGEKKGKSIAYALATQQAHKVGKSPKKFRTAVGVRTAKAKMTGPLKEYRKTAGVTMNGTMFHGFFDEMQKIGGAGLKKALQTPIIDGKVLKALKQAGGTIKNQYKRYGIKGLFD